MTVLSGSSIYERCQTHEESGHRRIPLIIPFEFRTKHRGMTYGCGLCGYDIRVAENVWLEPQDFVLVSSVERFALPLDIMGRVCDKSTWVRRGLCVQNTVLEPGWWGFLTLELTNHGKEGVGMMPGDPIAQVIFELLDRPVKTGYTGKYQNQPAGAQPAILEGVDPNSPTWPKDMRERYGDKIDTAGVGPPMFKGKYDE